jgi:hypothetical protein
MDIGINEVKDIIESLESNSEPSIKEEKYLKVAKLCVQLAAENVALKAGVTYFAYSPEYGFDYFKDKQSAIDTAQAEIDAYREDADDGWSEDVQRVSWGIVIQQAQGFDAQGLHTSDSQHTYQTCNYRLVDSVETPATDRIVAGIKADGVEWIEGHEPSEFGRYWVRYETDIGPQYCSAQWMEYNFCASSDTNIHKIWLADHSRSINSLKGVTHYTKIPAPLEGGAL